MSLAVALGSGKAILEDLNISCCQYEPTGIAALLTVLGTPVCPLTSLNLTRVTNALERQRREESGEPIEPCGDPRNDNLLAIPLSIARDLSWMQAHNVETRLQWNRGQ